MDLQQQADAFVRIALRFADSYIRYGLDPYGNTPLVSNAIDPKVGSPVAYDSDYVRLDAILSNPASQFNWLRLLRGLTVLTGEPGYRELAVDTIRFMFRRQADANGLLYWGGHNAFLLKEGKSAYQIKQTTVHELKMHYPDYAFMWEVDPQATKRYIESMWNAHVLNWEILDFNRHGRYNVPLGPVWNHAYKGGDVFFWGEGRTFVNAGSDLYYAAAMLAHLAKEEAPLVWSERLAHRYVETRQEGIGISGYQFSQIARGGEPYRLEEDRAYAQLAHLLPGHLPVFESMIFKPRPPVQRCQLVLGELLQSRGAKFRQWAWEEITAWGKRAYRKSDNCFIPMLTNGYSLEGLMLDRDGYFGKKGTVWKAIPATADFFWLYAMAYRLTGDDYCWQMARDIWMGLGMGDIGERGNPSCDLILDGGKAGEDVRGIYGLLELYRATGRKAYLEQAAAIGQTILRRRYMDGWFLTGSLALANDPAPFALLSLAAVIQGEDDPFPEPFH